MMKKLLLILLVCLLLVPSRVHAEASTLGDLKNELAKLKAQKSNNESQKKKTQAEIEAENYKIRLAHEAVQQAENDIEIAKEDIEKAKKDIEDMKDQTEELLRFYQIMSSDNEYLEYISGASTISELILRTDSVGFIINYNTDLLNKFENAIIENEQLQVDLKKKEADLTAKISDYEKSIDGLQSDMSTLTNLALDINAQIKAQQELISYYETIGCQDDQLLSTCVDVEESTRWLRPLTKGVITSDFGYRTITLNGKTSSGYHTGVDIGGNSGGTPIYAAANGTVAALIKKASCGGNQVYIHVRMKGVSYTIAYMHLLDFNVKVGDKVNQNTIVGYVGGGGKTLKQNGGWDTCSTGYHLHYSLATGLYFGGGPEGYSTYNQFVKHLVRPPLMPTYGQRFYSRY